MIDGYMPKIEEWVERSKGKVRGDVVHSRLVALGVHQDRADHPAGGRAGQGRVAGRAPAHLPAVDHRAGAVAVVRLG